MLCASSGCSLETKQFWEWQIGDQWEEQEELWAGSPPVQTVKKKRSESVLREVHSMGAQAAECFGVNGHPNGPWLRTAMAATCATVHCCRDSSHCKRLRSFRQLTSWKFSFATGSVNPDVVDDPLTSTVSFDKNFSITLSSKKKRNHWWHLTGNLTHSQVDCQRSTANHRQPGLVHGAKWIQGREWLLPCHFLYPFLLCGRCHEKYEGHQRWTFTSQLLWEGFSDHSPVL